MPAVADLLGRCRGSRLGGGPQRHRARRRASAETSTLAGPEGAGELPVAALTLDERVDAADRRARRPRWPPPTSPTGSSAGLRAASGPAWRMAAAFARWLEALLGPLRPGRVRVGGPGGQAAGRRPLRARAAVARTDRRPRRGAGAAAAGARTPAAGRAAARQPVALFRLDERAGAIRRQGDGFADRRQRRTRPPRSRPKRWITRSASARTCCCGRSCRTRCSRPSVTSPARASSPTSASCAASTSTSACRCRSCIRAPAPRCSIRPPRGSSPSTTSPFEDLQPQDESALNRLLAVAAADSRSSRR